MSKKKFINDDVFSAMTSSAPPMNQPTGNQPTNFMQRQPEAPPPPRRSTEAGLTDGLTRATIIVPKQLLEKCKDIAYWERLRDQDIYAAALTAYIAQHEKQMGRSVESRPVHARRDVGRAKHF